MKIVHHQKAATVLQKDDDMAVCLDDSGKSPSCLSKKNRWDVQARQWKAQQERKASARGESSHLRRYLSTWLQMRRPSLRPATYDAYRTCLARYVFPMLSHLSVQALTERQIEKYLRHVSANHLRLIQSVLDQALADAATCKPGEVLSSQESAFVAWLEEDECTRDTAWEDDAARLSTRQHAEKEVQR